ncbi:MAG TPA: hypothetical protein VFV99_04450, partial [Kofleriaceae bacterium]|nr:hypothetical protein [Kofleriaceae bacterium]
EANDVIVLAHTRSSAPVAYEVATRLGLPLELFDHGSHVADKTVLLIDDGDDARGMVRSISELRERAAVMVVAATAVASPAVYTMLRTAADHVSCILSPQHIYSVQAWFADFEPPNDEEIQQLLAAAAQNLLLLRRSNFLTSGVDT